jgi:hypothetical protein
MGLLFKIGIEAGCTFNWGRPELVLTGQAESARWRA